MPDPPQRAPQEWSMSALREHLETAMLVEMYTIPLYLFAGYSIKNRASKEAKDIFRIVREEMLHLALAGNLLCAVRGKPRVYGRSRIPQYPSKIFYDKVPMNLKPARKETIKTFVKIERPALVPFDQPRDVLVEYQSIGEFYDKTRSGLKTLHDRIGPDMFDQSSLGRQYTTGDGLWGNSEQLRQIGDWKTADDSLELIIEQGEGNTGTNPSHFRVFSDMSEKDLDVWDLVEDPETSKFQREKVYPVMLQFDAAYSYMLLAMEALWAYNGPRREPLAESIMGIMRNVLRPLASFLVKQKLENPSWEGKHAAPAFNFYEFTLDESPLTQLKRLADDALQTYPDEDKVKEAKDAVYGLFDLGLV